MTVRLEGELSPAGGNFTLQYDPNCLQLTSVLKLHPAVELLTWNEPQPGTVHVSFSGTQPLSTGELCAAMFRTVGTAGDTSAVTLTDVRMYDTDGKSIDASAEDGSVDVVLPSDRAPKLWAVGGAIQPDGSAVVSVVLQGRGIVCGGSFTLTYDQSLSVQAEPAGGCQINAEPGKLRASFASATPVADQVSLLKLTIQNAVPGAIDLSNAIFRDDSGSRIAAADVRPTTLSYTTSAAAFAGTLRADTSAGQTQYLLDVDVSDMRAGTPEARTEFTCLLALYDSDGLMEGLSVQKIAASDTGVNELTLTASASKTPAYAKVFLLSDASARPFRSAAHCRPRWNADEPQRADGGNRLRCVPCADAERISPLDGAGRLHQDSGGQIPAVFASDDRLLRRCGAVCTAADQNGLLLQAAACRPPG